jgi:hypothetical protein
VLLDFFYHFLAWLCFENQQHFAALPAFEELDARENLVSKLEGATTGGVLLLASPCSLRAAIPMAPWFVVISSSNTSLPTRISSTDVRVRATECSLLAYKKTER